MLLNGMPEVQELTSISEGLFEEHSYTAGGNVN
jgi:hypothetical protein